MILILCTAHLWGWAQTGSYSLDFKVSQRDFADTIAIEYEHGQVYIPVTIGGDTLRFLFDTGASMAVVYDNRPIEGCTEAGSIESFDAVGHSAMVKVLRLPPMTLGRMTLTGCKATVQHRIVRRKGMDGILGFDIVNKGLAIKIDTRRKQLVITDRRRFFRDENGYEAHYSMLRHVPYVTLSPFEGYSEQVLFDTGSSELYAMNKESFDRGEQACVAQNAQQIEGRSIGRYAMGFTGTEDLGEVVFLGIDRLQWGTFEFRDIHTLTTRGGSHIGAKILDYGSIIIDPYRKRMVLQPFDGEPWVTIGNRQTEKAIVNERGLPVVGLVWKRGEAYKAGLRQGDVILKADNQPIISFHNYVAFRPLRNKIYEFLVRDRRGFMKTVKMKW
jgi:hypothetical protein